MKYLPVSVHYKIEKYKTNTLLYSHISKFNNDCSTDIKSTCGVITFSFHFKPLCLLLFTLISISYEHIFT